MLKQPIQPQSGVETPQPPSGGCVLKQVMGEYYAQCGYQPPSGGCVLKPALVVVIVNRLIQPPSGGCVLKL